MDGESAKNTLASRSTTDRLPGWHVWTETVIGLWVVVILGFGMVLVDHGARHFYESVPITGPSAYLAWFLQFAIIGGVAIGGTCAYLRFRDVDASFVVAAPRDEDVRSLGRLAALVAGFLAAAGVASELTDISVRSLTTIHPISGYGPEPLVGLDGWTSLIGGTLFLAFIHFAFVGPGIAAITHGVLQNAFREATTPDAAIGLTALSFAVHRAAESVVGVAASVRTVVPFLLSLAFVAGVAYVYERSRNLLLPMVAYGLVVAASLLAGTATALAGFGWTLP